MCSLCSTVCSQSSLLPLGLSVGLSVCRSGHMTTSTSTSSNCSSPCVCVQPAHTHSHTEQETKPSLSWAAPCSAACVWVCVPAGSGAVEARHGRSEERTRSDRLPAEKPRCGRHTAVGAAHLLRQVCGGTERRQTEQHRPHRGRRPGRPAGRDGEWTRMNTHLSSIITCIDPEESTMTSDWVFIVTWMKFKVTLSNFIVFLSADYRLYVTTEGRCGSLLPLMLLWWKSIDQLSWSTGNSSSRRLSRQLTLYWSEPVLPGWVDGF